MPPTQVTGDAGTIQQDPKLNRNHFRSREIKNARQRELTSDCRLPELFSDPTVVVILAMLTATQLPKQDLLLCYLFLAQTAQESLDRLQ